MPGKDKRIILTGGAGFIGSAFLHFLNEQGITNIVVVDNLGSSEKWRNLVGKQFAEIVQKEAFFSWLERQEEKFDAIVHLGACSSTLETNANYLLENNVHYSQKLISYAIKQGIRMIYASSAATYGDGSAGFSDDHSKLFSLRPLNIYGYSKHLVDLWAYREGYLDKVVALKYFNVFGPNEYHKGAMTSALYKMVPQIRESGSAKLFKFTKSRGETEDFADGEQRRDFLYVKDAAKMTALFLDNEATGIFNVGMGSANTWNYLAKTLFAALGLPERISYIDMPKELQGKYQNYTCAEMKKFLEVAPQFKFTPLHEAIFDYVQNYLPEEKRW